MRLRALYANIKTILTIVIPVAVILLVWFLVNEVFSCNMSYDDLMEKTPLWTEDAEGVVIRTVIEEREEPYGVYTYEDGDTLYLEGDFQDYYTGEYYVSDKEVLQMFFDDMKQQKYKEAQKSKVGQFSMAGPRTYPQWTFEVYNGNSENPAATLYADSSNTFFGKIRREYFGIMTEEQGEIYYRTRAGSGLWGVLDDFLALCKDMDEESLVSFAAKGDSLTWGELERYRAGTVDDFMPYQAYNLELPKEIWYLSVYYPVGRYFVGAGSDKDEDTMRFGDRKVSMLYLVDPDTLEYWNLWEISEAEIREILNRE